ncbi:MAG: hypothetical protein AAB897_00325, partial [Patescibacteria group bacterium]
MGDSNSLCLRVFVAVDYGIQNILREKGKSGIIKDKLFNEEEFKKARLVMFYDSLKDEVNTLDMIDEALKTGKRV